MFKLSFILVISSLLFSSPSFAASNKENNKKVYVVKKDAKSSSKKTVQKKKVTNSTQKPKKNKNSAKEVKKNNPKKEIKSKTLKKEEIKKSVKKEEIKKDEAKKEEMNMQFYFLIDPDTNEILLSKNADVRAAPSSMTKLMTAYVVFDQMSKGAINPNQQCLVGKNAWKKSGSSMFLNYRDMVSIDELLKGLLVVSGNDAAIVLAESISGSVANFADLMNLKAREIGLKNSHFKNPHGLNEEDHYMTVRDLSTLATRIYRDFPEYSEYLGIKDFTYRNITQHNRNPLIKNDYEGVLGGKTGHTDDGGYGVVGVVKRQDRRLIAVVNKAKTPKQRTEMITKIFDYGFDEYKKLTLFKKDQDITKLKTWLGKKNKLAAVSQQDISFNIPREKSLDSINVTVKYSTPIYAPIAKGDKIAKLYVEIKNYKTLEFDLFAKEDLEKSGYFGRIKQILSYKLKTLYNNFRK
jgi:D-alanyl-D-alanine carboxypeptidase (penicillin-binding protein 5/6)